MVQRTLESLERTLKHRFSDRALLERAVTHSSLAFETDTPGYLHPGSSARAVMDGRTVAVFGQLHPQQ